MSTNKLLGKSITLTDSQTANTSLTRPTAGTETEDPHKPVALLVSHGMGQQVPFATLAAVVELLQGPGGHPGADTVVTHVRYVDPDSKRETWLPRAELHLAHPNGGAARAVHVYETYWAPLTEGNISLSEVIRFMASAGWRGLRLWPPAGEKTRLFRRWLFGKVHAFAIPSKTMWGLLLALFLVVALVVVNTLLTLVAGANLLGFATISAMPAKLIDALTLDLLLTLLPASFAACWLYFSQKVIKQLGKLDRKIARRLTPASEEEIKERAALRARQAVHRLTRALLWGAAGSLLVTTCLMVGHYAFIDHALAKGDPDWGVLLPEGLRQTLWAIYLRKTLIALVWGATAGISLFLRNFLVQYLGDVAIYLDAYKVDKFYKVREEIKRQAIQTACVLFGARQRASEDAKEPLPFAYDRLVLVGHSLGLVVTYDALNAVLHLDESMDHPLHADIRTGGLVTFGSPLDKTAYIFHTQTAPTSVRPLLTASVQPLLRAWRARHYVKWINIYSPNDIISGKLNFYDAPAHDRISGYQAVDNWVDEDARTPLAAHNQYWNNAALAAAIQERIFARRTADPVELAMARV